METSSWRLRAKVGTLPRAPYITYDEAPSLDMFQEIPLARRTLDKMVLLQIDPPCTLCLHSFCWTRCSCPDLPTIFQVVIIQPQMPLGALIEFMISSISYFHPCFEASTLDLAYTQVW